MASNGSLGRTRWAAIGAAVAVSLGAGGFGLAGATTSSGERPIYLPIEPCRLADTRPAPTTVGTRDTPIGSTETETFSGWGPVGECTLASGTSALSLNVTAVGATAPTFLQFFPAGTTRPAEGSNLNPVPGQPPTPNAVNVTLSDAGEFSLYNLQGTVNVIIDVVGVFDDHDHDDRYYTEGEADARFTTDEEVLSLAGDRELCGPNKFNHNEANANAIRAFAGPRNIFCSLDLPVGARVTRISAAYHDNDGGENGFCYLGRTAYSDRVGETLGTTTTTAGSSSVTQEVDTSAIAPDVVADDHHYWLGCRVSTNLWLVAATVSFDFP